MRFQATIVAFAASLALTGAQDLSAIPQCALPCLISAVPASGCTANDVTCQCTTGQAKLAESIAKCVPGACGPEDQAKLAPALAGICAAAGVTVSAAPSAAPSGVSSAVASLQSGLSSAASSAASAATSALSGSRTATGSASATRSSPAQASTAAAAANFAGLGAVAMGLAAFAL
ncbi:hypothetical protein T440DRAFT_17358 [Plenodomus tracheiphilus IPT5]|uniref:CFEM domain-containing protein n=1 Tax=Plenodomus tracheiphilus IPT5 TaxID=1408161 RepID=A0A6A7BEY2_9PLEO|nr:hypothetical protein T440DRAFT_17358 [Plenodomus tracheiphilus IPT5]